MKNNAFTDWLLQKPGNTWPQYHKTYIFQGNLDCPYHWAGSFEDLDKFIRALDKIIEETLNSLKLNPERKRYGTFDNLVKMRATTYNVLTKRRSIKRMNLSTFKEMKVGYMEHYVGFVL